MDELVVLDHGCAVYSASSRSVYSSNSSSCGEMAMYFCFLVLASSSLSLWLTGAVTMISRSICAVLLLTSRRNHNPEAASLTLSFWAPLVIFWRLFMEVNGFTPRLLVRRRCHATKDLPTSPSRALLVPCLQTFVSLASSGSQPNAMVRCVSATRL